MLGGLSPEAAAADSDKASKKRCVNVYTFANSVAFYTRVFDRVLNTTGRLSHVILATRTAHPNLLVAARNAKMDVIACVTASDHSFKHGEELLEKLLVMQQMPAARQAVKPALVKRVAVSSLQFISVEVEGEQGPAMKSVRPTPESAWRGGFNLNPSDLETKMLKQMHWELENAELFVQKGMGGRLCGACYLVAVGWSGELGGSGGFGGVQ